MENVEIARTLNAYADLLDTQGENPSLVTLDDIRGDLQMHSTWSDGSHTIEEMARACQGRGYEYCAITDHSKSTRIAGGLGIHSFTKHWDEIARVRQRLDGYVVLAGVELDILPDGSLDLPDDVLERFDIVVASVHSKLNMTKMQMTKRILKALRIQPSRFSRTLRGGRYVNASLSQSTSILCSMPPKSMTWL
jgi:DNA polymerase (family 10)